jgi:hypothetical protein
MAHLASRTGFGDRNTEHDGDPWMMQGEGARSNSISTILLR